MATVSLPLTAGDALKRVLPNPPFTPTEFSKVFEQTGFRIIGPASLSYAEQVPSPNHAVRSLTAQDQMALQRLQAACEFTEWEHGGSDSRSSSMSGVFAGDDLVSVSGYEQWGDAIAHISVVTHPAHRGRGYARTAVAEVARAALNAGLIPQYRTLESNGPSMSVARSLGFVHYATSVAVKLEGAKFGTVVATDVTEL
jgi:GNAT superfamily N-acetyltransferase